MTLQQMRYLLAIAEHGSISAAARAFFTTPSTLSAALKDAEAEMGITIFMRSNRGVEATLEGHELLSLARQIVEQDDLLNWRFGKENANDKARFSVSSQHYSLGVDAFSKLVSEYPDSAFSFAYRETRTQEVIDDVKSFRSDVGLLYLSKFNERIIQRDLERAGVTFTPLFHTKPHALVAAGHPLAKRPVIKPADLADYPCIMFEQGADDSLYYAEEPLVDIPRRSTIVVRDRSTMVSMLANSDCYTIGTGIRSTGMDIGVVGIRLQTSEIMRIGYISNPARKPSVCASRYIEIVKELACPLAGRNLLGNRQSQH